MSGGIDAAVLEQSPAALMSTSLACLTRSNPTGVPGSTMTSTPLVCAHKERIMASRDEERSTSRRT